MRSSGGRDLGAPDEMLLTEQFDRPLFVHDYPKVVKAFYMKENPDDPRDGPDVMICWCADMVSSSEEVSVKTISASCWRASGRRSYRRIRTPGIST